MIQPKSGAGQKCLTCILGLAIVVLSCMIGCKSGPVDTTDSKIESTAEKASTAYAEGNLDTAEKYYRSTLKRAFAIDDPLESGNASYNLAAVLTSKLRYAEAKSWLLACRVDLRRAGMDESGSWILEAKIARTEERFADVDSALAEVDRLRCEYLETHSCKGAGKKEKDCCDKTFCEKLPWIGPRKTCEKELNQYDSFIEVQTRLVRAAAALDQGDIPTAKCQLEEARARVDATCCGEVMGEVEHVAGRIAMAEGDFHAAGEFFDAEIEILRQVKNYREIPGALDLAAKAYESAGEPTVAAERLVRLARVYYGRDKIREAYDVIVHRAIVLADGTDDEELGARMGLLYATVEKALADLKKAEKEQAKKDKAKAEAAAELALEEAEEAADAALEAKRAAEEAKMNDTEQPPPTPEAPESTPGETSRLKPPIVEPVVPKLP
jgi:tetratricopeptide (TPR) repeat protein